MLNQNHVVFATLPETVQVGNLLGGWFGDVDDAAW